jgi:mannose-6-phosphate isomerase-like protein (cupin superfamily)
MADLFEPDAVPGPKVIRRQDRPTLAFGVLGKKALLTPKPLHHLEVFVGELEVGGSTGDQPYVHGDSEELVVVISGSVQLELGGELFDLERGDSIDYRSSTPHRVSNTGQEVAEVMWIISPPSY